MSHSFSQSLIDSVKDAQGDVENLLNSGSASSEDIQAFSAALNHAQISAKVANQGMTTEHDILKAIANGIK